MERRAAATFLYDRAGTVVFKHKGRIKPAELLAVGETADVRSAAER